MASTNPPRNSIMIGSANVAIRSLYLISSPAVWVAVSVGIRNQMLLVDTDSSMMTIMRTDVAQIGIASVIHMIAANANMAITLCSTTDKSFMPKAVDGKSHSTSKAMVDSTSPIVFLLVMICL